MSRIAPRVRWSAAALGCVLLVICPVTRADDDKKPAATQPASAAGAAAAAKLHPKVVLETSLGNITLELDAEKAPITVDNFLTYAEEGYYKGTVFHRVISTFMIQGGGMDKDLKEKGEGHHPPILNEWKNGLKNERGTISMARTQNPHSATSQFFINVVDNTMLDTPRDGAAYCVFGRVVDGLDTVDKIRDTPVAAHPNYPSPQPCVPKETVEILSVKLMGECDRSAIKELAKQSAERIKTEKDRVLTDLIAKLEKETGKKAEKTASGLQFFILQPGDGPSPKPTDRVTVHYTGWLVDGTKFDSSVDRGEPAKFPLNGVIKGWTEGVGLMKMGEKRKLIIPPEIAYGPQGRPPVIPGNAWLVFDVELLGIE